MRLVRKTKRPGTSMAEAVVILIVFLILIVGTFDIGTAVFQNNLLSAAARNAARLAIVKGAKSPPANGGWSGRWGPWTGTIYPRSNPYTVQASKSTDPIARATLPYLSGMDPRAVTINVQWLDANNSVSNDRTKVIKVRVTVYTPYQPLSTFFVSTAIPLSASSTMLISH
jgi:hypothetical protein